jgi:cysteine dioxygenase
MQEKINSLILSLKSVKKHEDYMLQLINAKLTLKDLEPYIHFEGKTYTRNLIFKCPDFELMSLCWGPGHETPIHDHSGSYGTMIVMDGCLHEVLYKALHETKCLSQIRETEAISGTATSIHDGIGYHKILNRSHKRAVTLHLYAKPIESFYVYNPINLNRCVRESRFYSRFGRLTEEFSQSS